MTAALPSLDTPTRFCLTCDYPLTFQAPDWCPVCEAAAADEAAWREQERQAAIRLAAEEAAEAARLADLEQARCIARSHRYRREVSA
jgi:hypothetical protein